jgi:MGT family glycosyltransferase
MAKYGFLFVPSQGHVNSSLPLAAELIARGEEVVYYLPEKFEGTIRAIGAGFRSYHVQEKMPPPQATLQDVLPIVRLQSFFARQSLYVLPQVLDRLQAEKLDYVVYDGMCLWARIAIELLGIPAITIRTSFVARRGSNIYKDFLASEAGQSWSAQKGSKESLVGLSGLHLQLSQVYGVKIPGLWSIFTHAGPLNIVFLPSFFHPGAEDFDERFAFVGPYFVGSDHVFSPVCTDFPFHRLRQRPLLYISLGTTELNARDDIYRTCLMALKDTPWQIVLAYGRNLMPSQLPSVPTNALLFPYVPQVELLRRAQIFVTHGGLCSVMESLYFGVPMLVLPMMEEHAIIGKIIEEQGVGIVLKPELLTTRQLCSTLEQLLEEPRYRQNATALRTRIRACGGYRTAVDLILRFGQTGR